MRALLGFGILAAGVLLGAAIYRQPEDQFARFDDAVTTAVRSSPVSPVVASTPEAGPAPRSFSPRTPEFAGVASATRQVPPPLAPIAAGLAPPSVVVTPAGGLPGAASPAARGMPPVVVTLAPGGMGGPVHAVKPGDEAGRRELVRGLQQELKRAGCYDGPVSGDWTPTTKKALGAFIERVNSGLPVEEPDYILLSLTRSHGGQVCGKGCSADEGAGVDGRCLPKAVLAQQAARKLKGERGAVAPAVAEVAPRLVQPATPAPALPSSWSPSVVVAPADPLPGRMAVGAMPPEANVTTGSIAAPPVAEPAPQIAPRAPEIKKRKEAREAQPSRTPRQVRSVVEIFTNPIGRN